MNAKVLTPQRNGQRIYKARQLDISALDSETFSPLSILDLIQCITEAPIRRYLQTLSVFEIDLHAAAVNSIR